MPNFLTETFNKVVSSIRGGAQEESKSGVNALALNPLTAPLTNIKKLGLRKPSKFSFQILRQIARADAITRICVNVIKKSTSQAERKIGVNKRAPESMDFTTEIDKVYELFDYMNDNEENVRMLLDRICEDMLVLDAGAIEIVRSIDGKEIVALNSIDGATIRPIYNEYGELGSPAYKQFINTEEVAQFEKEDIVYLMANPQNDINTFGYGLSPIESIILQVQAALEADMHNIKTFSTNNVPPGLLDLGDIGQEQAEEFIATWNATVIGNNDAMKFVWGSDNGKKFIPFQTTNRDMQYSEYTDWLSRIKLATYGLTGLDANITQDVNRSTSEAQMQITNSRGVKSMKSLISEYFTRQIIRRMGPEYKYLEFQFVEQENIDDKVKQAEIDAKNIASRIYSPQYVQERDNLPETDEFDEELDAMIAASMQAEEDRLLKEEEIASAVRGAKGNE